MDWPKMDWPKVGALAACVIALSAMITLNVAALGYFNNRFDQIEAVLVVVRDRTDDVSEQAADRRADLRRDVADAIRLIRTEAAVDRAAATERVDELLANLLTDALDDTPPSD